jgi:hypothetical protein
LGPTSHNRSAVVPPSARPMCQSAEALSSTEPQEQLMDESASGGPDRRTASESGTERAIRYAVYLTGGLVMLAFGALELSSALGQVASCIAQSPFCPGGFSDPFYYIHPTRIGGRSVSRGGCDGPFPYGSSFPLGVYLPLWGSQRKSSGPWDRATNSTGPSRSVLDRQGPNKASSIPLRVTESPSTVGRTVWAPRTCLVAWAIRSSPPGDALAERPRSCRSGGG